jgi:hypothetical protein
MSVKLFYDPHRVEQLRQRGIAPVDRAPRNPADQAQLAIDAVEECARLRMQVAQLRRDNQRLVDENARLRSSATQPVKQAGRQ